MIRKRTAFVVISGLLVVAVAVAGGMRWQLKQGRSTPPPMGVAVTMEKVAVAAEFPAGFVVWSSNRFGNHDILKMDLPGRKITRLTTSPYTEYFPRISPDGRYVVFSRSQKPWVSQRNQKLWDVILLDLKTGEERELAKNGNTPRWSVDGRKVYFQNNIASFTEVDLNTGKKKTLIASGTGQLKKGAVLYTPNYSSRKNKMAVTLQLRDYTATIVDAEGRIKEIAYGCQVSWSKQGDFLYYVGFGGKMKNAFYLYDPITDKSTKWLDLPGDFSHEYFPKLSNDEKYLVFAASKGGHEHDSADYEIFLWQVGAPAESATRLTFHTGNDNWPDVFLLD